jgi:predicted TPR repeat methyltransferase
MSDFDAQASTWDSDPAKVDRARRVAAAIVRSVPDLGLRSVLDYGAGTGLLGFELLPRAAQVTLADTSEGMLAVARRLP